MRVKIKDSERVFGYQLIFMTPPPSASRNEIIDLFSFGRDSMWMFFGSHTI